MTVSAALDRLTDDDENVNICQFVAISIAYEIYTFIILKKEEGPWPKIREKTPARFDCLISCFINIYIQKTNKNNI